MFRYTENHVPQQRQDVMRGWWCIFGVSLVFIFNVSLIPTFEMLFDPFFGENIEIKSVIMYLFTFLSNLTIVATGFLLKDLSAKHFVIIGSSITFLGLLTSSFVTSSTQLMYTFSVFTGVGIGLLNPAAFVAVLSCFTCQRVHAISLGFGALGLGQMIMPQIVREVTTWFSPQNSVLVISGMSLIGLIGGNFLVPIKWRPRVRLNSESQPLIIQKDYGKPTVIIEEIVQATDVDLMSNLKYIVIIFGLSIVYAASTNLSIILPVYLEKHGLYDSIQIENCISTITIADIVCRLGYPMIYNSLKLTSRYFFILGVVGLAMMRFVFLYIDFEHYQLVLIFCALLGFFRAITVVNQVFVLCDFCEENCPTKLPGTLGLSVVIKAALLIFYGWIFKGLWSTNSQLYMNFYMHIVLFVVVIFLWILEDESSPTQQRFMLSVQEASA